MQNGTAAPGQVRPQSKQSAQLFFHSSELGLPHSLTHRRVCPPPWRGGGTIACGRGGGGVQLPSTTGDTHVLCIYKYIVWVRRIIKLNHALIIRKATPTRMYRLRRRTRSQSSQKAPPNYHYLSKCVPTGQICSGGRGWLGECIFCCIKQLPLKSGRPNTTCPTPLFDFLYYIL